MSDLRFLHLAIETARAGVDAGQMPYGAAVVRGDDELIACANNSAIAMADPSAHAEMLAIRQACIRLGRRDLGDCQLFSTCEPCLMCFGVCFWAGVSSITYGASLADKAKFGLPDPGVGVETLRSMSGSKVQINGGVLREECVELFRRFLARRKSS